MKGLQVLLAASTLTLASALSLSAAQAQSAAGLSATITSNTIAAAGVAGSLQDGGIPGSTTGGTGIVSGGLSSGSDGATASVCVSANNATTPDANCFSGGSTDVTVTTLSTGGSTIVSPSGGVLTIGASAGNGLLSPTNTPLIPDGGNVAIVFDGNP